MTFTYNNAGQPLTITTPAPGSGLPSQTTVNSYNSMMRLINVDYPDSGRSTNEYFLTGQLKKSTGSRT